MSQKVSTGASASARKGKGAKGQQNLTIIIVIAVVAIFAVGAAIFMSSQEKSSASDIDYSAIPQERTEDGAFILGDPNAPITIVEFADFLCPHCQAYEPTIERFVEEYVATGQARFEFRMLATQDLSPYVFSVAECADAQVDNGFWVAHDELFYLANRGYRDDIGREVSERMGLNYAELLECTSESSQVENDARVANSQGVSGTPAVRVRYNNGPMQAVPGYERGPIDWGVLSNTVQAANALN